MLSLTMVRVVMVGSETGDDFDDLDSCRDIIFGGSKDKTSNDLDGFSSGGVGDKEQNP